MPLPRVRWANALQQHQTDWLIWFPGSLQNTGLEWYVPLLVISHRTNLHPFLWLEGEKKLMLRILAHYCQFQEVGRFCYCSWNNLEFFCTLTRAVVASPTHLFMHPRSTVPQCLSSHHILETTELPVCRWIIDGKSPLFFPAVCKDFFHASTWLSVCMSHLSCS